MSIQSMSVGGRFSTHKFALLAAVGLTALIIPQRSANAALELSLDGGVPVVDNGAGDTNPSTGVLVNSTSIGGFVVTVSVASSNSPGNAASGQISIASLDITSNNPGPATLTIQTSDIGFAAPGGALSIMNLQSSVSGTFTANDSLNDSVSFISNADPANGQPAAATSTPIITINNAPPSTNSTNSTHFVRGAGAYSLSDTITVTLYPNDTANITGTTTATDTGNSVPEPTLGVVPALALGLLARRRRNSGKAL
jgi:MYXO-CTERM domain-containing protein